MFSDVKFLQKIVLSWSFFYTSAAIRGDRNWRMKKIRSISGNLKLDLKKDFEYKKKWNQDIDCRKGKNGNRNRKVYEEREKEGKN